MPHESSAAASGRTGQHLSIGMTLVLGLVAPVVGGVVANALGTDDLFGASVTRRAVRQRATR